MARRTTGGLERDDFGAMIPEVAHRFVVMIEVVVKRLVPPAMAAGKAVSPWTKAYRKTMDRLAAFSQLPVTRLPLVSPAWINMLIEEVVERKVALRGTPATYLLDPHHESTDDEITTTFNEGVRDYLIEAAEKFADYRRPWIDDPHAMRMYKRVKRHTVDELLSGTRVPFDHILGTIGPSDWQQWVEQAAAEGVQPDIEYLAQQAALRVAGLSRLTASLMGLGSMGDREGSASLQDPEVFRAAVFQNLDEAIASLRGEIPEDDPLWLHATTVAEDAPYFAYPHGRRVRAVFLAAAEAIANDWREANRRAAHSIEVSGEARRMPGLAWLPIAPGAPGARTNGATDLDLAQRAWLWEHQLTGSDFASDLWRAITHDEWLPEQFERPES